jgi:hypothetical protein
VRRTRGDESHEGLLRERPRRRERWCGWSVAGGDLWTEAQHGHGLALKQLFETHTDAKPRSWSSPGWYVAVDSSKRWFLHRRCAQESVAYAHVRAHAHAHTHTGAGARTC